ncbi:MAG TPA: hypothetical protein VL361_13400 [Candidatus Limnocylindrales bacterium]|jgi:hypothetical protein|nr:hypothetical protein [Candidatus Limnocylindrales bacterium]
MLRTFKTLSTVNLPLSIAIFVAYVLYGLASGAPIGEHFFGMERGHLGRGGGPLVPPWVFYALAEGLILVLFVWARLSEGTKNYDRTFCLIFSVLFVIFFLMAHLPHRVIFPEDERVVVIPRNEQAMMWYLWCSIALFALTGANND